MIAPDWMTAPETPPRGSSGRGQSTFLSRTLESGLAVLRQTAFAEEVARRSGYLQRLDARTKTAASLSLLVAASLVRHPEWLLAILACALLVARLSLVPLPSLLLRVCLPAAAFAGTLALPAIFNVITPGAPLVVLLDLGGPARLGPISLPAEITITQPGVMGALLLIGRVGTSVTVVALLTLTTRWNDLLAAWRSLGIPRTFVAVMTMAYRYILVFVETAMDMVIARRSRQIGAWHRGEGRGYVATAIGVLFAKSLAHGEEVYAAMLSRGYDGEPRLTERPHLKARDAAWGAMCLLVAFLTVGGDWYLGT